MKKVDSWLRRIYRTKIQREFDRIVPVIGDEGMGKSTLMLETTARWQHIKGEDPTPESVLGRVVWDDRAEFRNALAESPRRAAIPVMDAAHVLYKRDSMDPEQKETEKGLLDVRTNEYLILLGYQSWGDIPSTLQDRRAKNALYIPARGHVWGYSRSTLDDKQANHSDDEWPEPDMRDRFPDLDGTEMWSEFKRRDREHKNARLRVEDEDEQLEEELTPRELAEEIQAEGIDRVVSIHGGNKQPYINPDLIEADYGVSARKAGKVKSLLEREVNVEKYA